MVLSPVNYPVYLQNILTNFSWPCPHFFETLHQCQIESNPRNTACVNDVATSRPPFVPFRLFRRVQSKHG